MANLLPPDKAAQQLERAAHDFLTAVQSVRYVVTHGKSALPKQLANNWAQAYQQLSAAQWEMEQVLKG
jgi:predicted TIM-barrel fold metal-dependent hydrolase